MTDSLARGASLSVVTDMGAAAAFACRPAYGVLTTVTPQLSCAPVGTAESRRHGTHPEGGKQVRVLGGSHHLEDPIELLHALRCVDALRSQHQTADSCTRSCPGELPRVSAPAFHAQKLQGQVPKATSLPLPLLPHEHNDANCHQYRTGIWIPMNPAFLAG